jgi:argonaute-like protein implicated in RNA metabolism and viral defense
MYVPRPLLLKRVEGQSAPRQLAEEVLALTKINWNNTQFDGGMPLTLRVAEQVGKILKYVPEGRDIQSSYAFYM